MSGTFIRLFVHARVAAVGMAMVAGCGSDLPAPEPGIAEASGTQSLDAASLRAAPTPRLPDGRPDLNGTWARAGGVVLGLEFVQPETLPDGSICVFGCPGDVTADAPSPDADEPDGPASGAADPFPPAELTFPSYRPEFQARVDELRERQVEADTVLRCYPPGVPRIGPPGKIVQTATEVVFLYNDYNGSFFRIVPLEGRERGSDLPASYLGDAVGRFEGDVLVVETVNFNAETWLTDDGAFHTTDLRVVERLRRVGNTIEYEAVAYDPDVLTEPWPARVQTLWLTDRALEEPVPCEERDLEHMTDASYHENPR